MRYLVEDPETNPRRRRRRRSGRRRMSAKQRAYFGGGRRRGRSNRRRSGGATVVVRANPRRRGGRRSRRRSYRRNPRILGLSLGGGKGLMGDVMRGATLYGGLWLGQFIEQVIERRVPGMSTSSNPRKRGLIHMGLAIAGGWALRRFGGPLRGLAAPFKDANMLLGFQLVTPSGWEGFSIAQRTGLGDYVTARPNGQVARAARGAMGSYLTAASGGLPAVVPAYNRAQ